jgi:dTDP-4-dehydrorhamnose reductase
MKLLILGANGMLGNACVNFFSKSAAFNVKATVRSDNLCDLFHPDIKPLLISKIDILDDLTQKKLFENERPDVVINCIGAVKQSLNMDNHLHSIALNSLLPHQLSDRCNEFGARLIHISTDCVFSGLKGSPYLESDISDANDLYGKTKFLGEVINKSHVITLRTSIIGNELSGNRALLEWFLSQKGECQGYTEAIFSGVPTLILAQAIESVLKAKPKLSGLFQVASEPISKYNLLKLIAQVFGKQIKIIPNAELVINRSLDGSKFRDVTGFTVPSWGDMIEKMYIDRMANVQK